ncbi:MAG: homoserine dehydrogenase [bacterium]|jgi:homoserine dehydrogenase|nr:homoserine dehydrogenase [Caldisericota bacterium]
MYKLALIGFGVVGQGFLELLSEKEDILRKNYQLEFQVVAISDAQKGSVFSGQGIDFRKALEWVKAGKSLNDLPGEKNGMDALSTIESCGADILFEATWTDIKTGEPALSHIRKALEKGMHVVTTNKGPLARYGKQLIEEAESRGLILRYEGTVMSGTPLLNLIRECLAGCEILEARGILNGTTNFILTKMSEGQSYEEALKTAQKLGYAEAVPDADVLGWDALAKVCILANTVFGASIIPDPEKLPCKGITGIRKEDIENAKREDQIWKLIARVYRENGAVKVRVWPEKIPLTDPLAGVTGAKNALTIKTDALEEITIAGFGAGRTPTGYAMLIDFIDIHKNLRRR